MKKLIIVFVISIGIIFLMGDLSQIFAQETEEFTLEEITVTAAKRMENQQRVAIAMEVVSGEQMKELGQTDISEILNNIGNIVITSAEDGYRVALRGVTNDFGVFQGQATSTPTVAISTDGVYSARNERGLGLFDVERVEVLYGPQSTLYANTSPGGIINIITTAPKTDVYEASGMLEYGNYSYLHTEGSVNAPVGDKIALRAAFSTANRNGYLSNGASDEDTKSARLKALFNATDNLNFTLTGEYSKDTSHGGFANVKMFADQGDVANPWEAADPLGAPSNKRSKGINANINWVTGVATITAVPSFSKTISASEETRSGMPGTAPTVNHNSFDVTEKSVDVRMVSASDFFFKWMVGFNYFYADNARFSTTEGSIATSANHYWNDQHAFYANMTYPLTDVFRVTGGMRKNWAKMTTHGENLNQAPGGFGPPAQGTTVRTTNPDGTVNTISDLVQNYPNWDYKVGVEYDLFTDSMLYADVSTSFRMQGQGMANAKGEYPPPEQMTAYTLGAKNRFLDNKLQVNVSAYYYNYNNKFAAGNPTWFIYMWEDDPRILNAVDKNGNPFNYTFVDMNGVTQRGIDLNGNRELNNAANPGQRGMSSLADQNRASWGDYMSRGLDLQTSWMITSSDRLDINYSYLDNEWTDLFYSYSYYWIYPDVDYSGHSNVNSPKHNISLNYNHNFNLWNGGILGARIETRYQSRFVVSFKEIDAPWNVQKAYHKTNVSFLYTNPDGNWSLSAYVKNLENYAVKQGLFGYGETTTGMLFKMMISEPRTIGTVLTVRF